MLQYLFVTISIFSALSASGPALAAAAEEDFWPGARYDAAVPTLDDVLGHAPGERIVSHAEILTYVRALEEARPRQVRVVEYARTWEDRALVYVVVGSEVNIARLDEIQSNMKRLAEPRTTTDAEADAVIRNQPAVTWLSYGVHGNEISSPDASLLTAYHLLAAQEDPVVDRILAESLVILVPTQNADGRDRFVNHYRIAEGLEPQGHPLAAEHDEPWPGGRTNHYYFDLNRDWLALTQPEIRGQVRAVLDWYPQVFVDLHEMGGNSTYYFPPEAVPYNPHITSGQRETLEVYGRNNAKWFDEYGFLYFTREIYDAFYPGYGASWPLYHGSIASTHEQASARGLVFSREDGTDLHFRDTVRHHFVASIATAETTAVHRERLLRGFWDYRKSAVLEGESEPTRAYVLVNEGGGGSRARKLAGVMRDHGVEVQVAGSSFQGCGREVPAGSFLIDMAQPTKRLIRTFLDADVAMSDTFLAEQERRRQKNLPDQIYDVTGWSLPLMFGVEALACADIPGGDFAPLGEGRFDPGSVTGGTAKVAYLVPWGDASAGRLLAHALRAGLHVLSSDRPTTQDGTTFPAGTLIFPVANNGDDLHGRLARIAEETGADVVATNTGWVESGVNFGSGNVQHVRAPRVALAWDTPTSAYSAGSTRFVLERQIGYPVTPIRSRRLASADLRAFDVLILPDGRYGSEMSEAATDNLKEFVEEGGTLIGLAGALDYLADAELLSTSGESQYRDEEETADEGDDNGARLFESEEDYLAAIEPTKEPPDSVSGVLVEAKLDPDHWLNAGAGERVTALLRGSAIYEPLTLDDGQNPAVLLGPDELLASGYLWEENRKQLAFKPLTMVEPRGRGLVIGFAADPTYRAYMDGMSPLLMNAVFRGPARARPPVLH